MTQGRVILALDATASRMRTWRHTSHIQHRMFEAASNLEVAIAYFRGMDITRECRMAGYSTNPAAIRRMMNKVQCVAGPTQISRILRRAAKDKPSALVYVGDQCEEVPAELMDAASAMKRAGVPAFVFHEVRGNADRAHEPTFKGIADITEGAYLHLDSSSPDRLAGLLASIAVYAEGGKQALEARGTDDDRFLLEHMR